MPNSLPLLIVGGFGASWHAYQPFQKALMQVCGRPVFVTRLETMDWMGVAVSDDYGALLKRLDIAVHDTLRRTSSDRLVLVAHSAGGILSRIYMGDQPYGKEQVVFYGFRHVSTIVTIGTPHTTPKRGRFGGMNQIAFTEEHYPGAYWRFIHYVTVISKAIFGTKHGTPHERGAWDSYDMLCGVGEQWGDGVVPVTCGVLEGARHVVLEGIRHDQRSDNEHLWYGHNERTILSWWPHVEQAERDMLPNADHPTKFLV